jgi:hypothetical protein
MHTRKNFPVSHPSWNCSRPSMLNPGVLCRWASRKEGIPYVTLFPNYLHYKLNQALSVLVNQVIEVQNQNSKSGVQIWSLMFHFVWTDILSQQIFRIYRSWIRPCSQKRIGSPWLILQVCKTERFMEIRKYLFERFKQSKSTQFQTVQISSSFCLTISTILNSIPPSILGYGVCLTPGP